MRRFKRTACPKRFLWGEYLRIHFRELPWDIYVSCLYVAILSISILASGVGTPLASLLVLFTPGYLAIATFFPRSDGIDWAERIVLSFVASVLFVPLTSLFVDSFYREPGVLRSLLAVDLLTVPLLATSYWRRMQTPAADRLAVDLHIQFRVQSGFRGRDILLAVFLGTGLLLAIGLATYEVSQPIPPDKYTEFYLLGPTGEGASYPLQLNRSQEGRIVIGVVNRESSNATYLLQVNLVGVRVVFDNDTHSNTTNEVNRTQVAQYVFALRNGENRTQDYGFWINSSGLWKLEFLLFKNRSISSDYLELHFFVRVS